MLCYVFWHWPLAEVATEAYETDLQGFQRSLLAVQSTGLIESAAFRVEGAPWVAGERAYQDCYLLEGSAALDVLNEAAVSPTCKQAHDRVARGAAAGVGGLYHLQRGDPLLMAARVATWLVKPRQTIYDEFYESLAVWTSCPGVSLWRRQMTLGPTPEFCLLTAEKQELPSGLAPLTTRLERIWP